MYPSEASFSRSVMNTSSICGTSAVEVPPPLCSYTTQLQLQRTACSAQGASSLRQGWASAAALASRACRGGNPRRPPTCELRNCCRKAVILSLRRCDRMKAVWSNTKPCALHAGKSSREAAGQRMTRRGLPATTQRQRQRAAHSQLDPPSPSLQEPHRGFSSSTDVALPPERAPTVPAAVPLAPDSGRSSPIASAAGVTSSSGRTNLR